MRLLSHHFTVAIAATAALSFAACGSDSGTTTTPATTADTASSVDAAGDTGAKDSGTTSDTVTGGMDAKADVKADVKKDTAPPKDTDGTIDEAVDLTFDDASGAFVGQDTLDPTGDVDYHKFEGKKGQLVTIYIESNQQQVPFDETTIDSIITLYGPDKKQIGFNDDPASFTDNDSTLLTVLPADGTYYIRVEECWTYVNAHPNSGGSCAPPEDKDANDYALVVIPLDPSKQANINPEIAEPNEITPTMVGYEKGQQYYLNTILYGKLESATDVDVYRFVPPADATVSEGRPSCHFDAGKAGTSGNGSTLDGLVVSVASESTPTVILAQADLTKGSINMPCELEVPYLISVKRIASSKVGADDFYIMSHYVGGSNPMEKDEEGNNTAAGAEVLSSQTTSKGLDAYYVSGDIIKGASDVDYFSLKVPVGTTTMTVYCGSATEGAGLVDFTAEVRTDADAPISGGTAVEDPVKGLALMDLAIPAGATKVLLRLSAKSQNATVTGAFYLCGIPFKGN